MYTQKDTLATYTLVKTSTERRMQSNESHNINTITQYNKKKQAKQEKSTTHSLSRLNRARITGALYTHSIENSAFRTKLE